MESLEKRRIKEKVKDFHDAVTDGHVVHTIMAGNTYVMDASNLSYYQRN